jgi:hypothetical protein
MAAVATSAFSGHGRKPSPMEGSTGRLPDVGWTVTTTSYRVTVDSQLRRCLASVPVASRNGQFHPFATRPRQASPRQDPSPLLEQPARLWGRASAKPPPPVAPTARPTRPPGGNGDDPENEATWGVWDPSRYSGSWQVPWGPGRVAGGIALWFGSFVGVGFILVPQLYRLAGVSLYDLPPEVGSGPGGAVCWGCVWLPSGAVRSVGSWVR